MQVQALTEGGPDGALPEFPFPNRGVEADSPALEVFEHDQRVFEPVVYDLTGTGGLLAETLPCFGIVWNGTTNAWKSRFSR